jgi:hypothetical protein
VIASRIGTVTLMFALRVRDADDHSTSNARAHVQDMLRLGADTNVRGGHEVTPLLCAAQSCSQPAYDSTFSPLVRG